MLFEDTSTLGAVDTRKIIRRGLWIPFLDVEVELIIPLSLGVGSGVMKEHSRTSNYIISYLDRLELSLPFGILWTSRPSL